MLADHRPGALAHVDRPAKIPASAAGAQCGSQVQRPVGRHELVSTYRPGRETASVVQPGRVPGSTQPPGPAAELHRDHQTATWTEPGRGTSTTTCERSLDTSRASPRTRPPPETRNPRHHRSDQTSCRPGT